MKLRAVLEVELEAQDYVAAAAFQQRMNELLSIVRREYAGAALEVRERRPRSDRPSRPPAERELRVVSGAARRIDYDDV